MKKFLNELFGESKQQPQQTYTWRNPIVATQIPNPHYQYMSTSFPITKGPCNAGNQPTAG